MDVLFRQFQFFQPNGKPGQQLRLRTVKEPRWSEERKQSGTPGEQACGWPRAGQCGFSAASRVHLREQLWI